MGLLTFQLFALFLHKVQVRAWHLVSLQCLVILIMLFVCLCQELEKILSDTPPVWRGSSKLFRNLRERGQQTHMWIQTVHRLSEFIAQIFISSIL